MSTWYADAALEQQFLWSGALAVLAKLLSGRR